MRRLFNLYGGKEKGYLEIKEAKLFVRDVLIVCEILDELEDKEATIDGIVRELDPNGTDRVYYSELLKPSWGKVQNVLHTVAGKMNQLVTKTHGGYRPPPIFPPPPPPPQDLPPPLPSNIIFPGSAHIQHDSSLSQSDLEENCPPSFICPISTEIMSVPVMVLETGATYDRVYIQQWFENHDTDPSTGVKVTSKEIVPVLALKNAIEEWKDAMKANQKRKEMKILEKEKLGKEKSERSERSEKSKERSLISEMSDKSKERSLISEMSERESRELRKESKKESYEELSSGENSEEVNEYHSNLSFSTEPNISQEVDQFDYQ